jgi:hypothetical protein
VEYITFKAFSIIWFACCSIALLFLPAPSLLPPAFVDFYSDYSNRAQARNATMKRATPAKTLLFKYV